MWTGAPHSRAALPRHVWAGQERRGLRPFAPLLMRCHADWCAALACGPSALRVGRTGAPRLAALPA
eukprot:10456448-Alexandrium_andersonii.AAC.1